MNIDEKVQQLLDTTDGTAFEIAKTIYESGVQDGTISGVNSLHVSYFKKLKTINEIMSADSKVKISNPEEFRTVLMSSLLDLHGITLNITPEMVKTYKYDWTDQLNEDACVLSSIQAINWQPEQGTYNTLMKSAKDPLQGIQVYRSILIFVRIVDEDHIPEVMNYPISLNVSLNINFPEMFLGYLEENS